MKKPSAGEGMDKEGLFRLVFFYDVLSRLIDFGSRFILKPEKVIGRDPETITDIK